VNRSASLDVLRSRPDGWDVIVVGGGATGLGVAVDAASRGCRTVLVEQHDFAKATSSRSTKIAHGGVRYLAQGDIGLVFEALHERGRMIANAPHLVYPLAYVVPAFKWWELPFYGIGLKLYDALAGRSSLGKSRLLSRREALGHLPTLAPEKLAGGILYMDGQFDDARLALALALTFADLGGTPLNYCRAEALLKSGGRVAGVRVADRETGEVFELRGKVVVNATGIFTDSIRRMDEPSAGPVLSVSQGAHLVLDRAFLPSDTALMIPKTEDGRVLFGIPWYGRLVFGTTDVPRREIPLEPRPLEEEIAFLLHHAGLYLNRPVKREDILSVFAGLRPLVRTEGASATSRLSRSHRILVSGGGLVTITGGKWTTYRRMAQDTVDRALEAGGLGARESKTKDLKLHGYMEVTERTPRSVYGSDIGEIEELARERPELAAPLHARLPYNLAEVVWAARREMARTVEDVLARRTRSLFLDARASMEAAPQAARLLARELGRDTAWEAGQIRDYLDLARNYLPEGAAAD
jgi:glycerol-3-phosphate dehydrogenase